MISKKLNENNIGINISRTIITIALIFSIYTFFGKEQIGAKLWFYWIPVFINYVI